jgi:Zn-dependent protease with chaperone function
MILQVIAFTALTVGVSMISYWVGRAVALNQIKTYLQKYLVVERVSNQIAKPSKPNLYVFNGGKKSEDRPFK